MSTGEHTYKLGETGSQGKLQADWSPSHNTESSKEIDCYTRWEEEGEKHNTKENRMIKHTDQGEEKVNQRGCSFLHVSWLETESN